MNTPGEKRSSSEALRVKTQLGPLPSGLGFVTEGCARVLHTVQWRVCPRWSQN